MAASLTRLERLLATIVSDLNASNVRYALVGGLAVAARGEPRTTRDVDLAVAVDDDRAAEALMGSLRFRRYEIKALLEQTRVHRIAGARLVHHTQPKTFVDLLFASSGIEAEIIGAAEPLDLLPDTPVPVATAAHLIALKILARDDRRRPQDWDDLKALIRNATLSEISTARDAVALIAERGYARGRELDRLLDEAVAEFGQSLG